MSNEIARHAWLKAGIQRTYAMGQQPPAQAIQELQRIESRAAASMTPQELQQAMAASTSMQAQYLQQHDAQAAMRDANNRGYYTEQLAKDLTGMTPDQIESAKRGKPIPVKGKGQTPYKENLRGMLYNAGLGDVPYEKFLKVADRVEDMKGAGKSPTAYLKQAFGNKAAVAESLIGAFHISGIGIELGISGEPEKDHYENTSEDLQRRTQIADSMARSAMKDPHDRAFVSSRIDQTYLESDTSQGDVARAFAQHENESNAEERQNYSAPSYEIDEREEVTEYATL